MFTHYPHFYWALSACANRKKSVYFPNMNEPDYIVVDVETTGFKPAEGHCIIEIAAERLRGGRVVDSFQSLVLSERPIDPETVLIHGITDELLRLEGRPVHEVMSEFLMFVQDAPLIGHNIGFDLAFINAHLERLNCPRLTNKTIDTIELARKYLIITGYSLEKVAAYLKVPQPSAHRAKVDVEVTRQVFLKLNERAQARGGKVAPVATQPDATPQRPALPVIPPPTRLF